MMDRETDAPMMELGTPGPMRDALVAAVLRGEKTATTSLVVQYEDDDEGLPQPGVYALIDSQDHAVAKVEVVEVNVIEMGDADLELALGEGEGFRTVAEWRSAHVRFWARQLKPSLRDPAALRLDDETKIVVERFRVIETLAPKSA
jgi:uncharacterized protein YhfF